MCSRPISIGFGSVTEVPAEEAKRYNEVTGGYVGLSGTMGVPEASSGGGEGNWTSKASDGLMWGGMAMEAGKQEVALSGAKSFGSNLQRYSKPFYGNQYVKTIQATKVLNAAKIVGNTAGAFGMAADMVNYFGFNGMSANRFNTKFAIGLISFVAPEIGIPFALIDYYYGDYIGDQINNAVLQIK